MTDAQVFTILALYICCFLFCCFLFSSVLPHAPHT